MEAASEVRQGLPQAAQLLNTARARLDAELAALPRLSGEALVQALHGEGGAGAASPGALVHLLRRAVSRRDEATAREIFILILRRTASANGAWARRTARLAWGVSLETCRTIEEDLHQELTLHLWEHLALRSSETWELFFRRALDYAQRHVATAYMTRNGYWRDPQTARPTRGLALVLSQLAPFEPGETRGIADSAQQAQLFAAELSDLRRLVANLPARERIAVILRFWGQADEGEIAEALGGVTTRTVRNVLRRAYALLRVRYAGEGGCE
jgi:DNA-directed RNA polymerase specialized sigma24 family protein